MKTKYKATYHGLPKIEVIIITSETEKEVIYQLPFGEVREAKESENAKFVDSQKEAEDFLLQISINKMPN